MMLSNLEGTLPTFKKLFKLNIMDQFTDDEASLFSDEGLLFGSEDSWNCDGCPPPVFNLPPPPRPPWLEDLDDCGSNEASLSEMLGQLETCDNTIIRDSHTLFEDTFHSVAVIVVSAIVLVVVLLVAAVMIFKKRKQLYRHSRECHPSHPLVSDLHQFNVQQQKDLQDQPQFMTADSLNNTGSLFRCSLSKLPQSGHKSAQAVTALTRNGQTMTRCCGNLEAHFQRHYNNNNQNNQANSLPNHYIPDHPAFTRLTEVRPRLSVPDRTVMELSERPPQLRAPTVIPPNAYPHIIIGGKPFYLIPSSGDESSSHNDGSFESYSYPQHIPIYEEIDGNSSCGRIYEPTSEMEYSSEQGEVGSVERLSHPVESMHRSPRLFRSMFTDLTPQHRPMSSATSHSQNSSQQTNTSEVSSSSSSTASTSNPNLQQQQLQQQHYVILDPELDAIDEQRKKKQLYENTLSKSSKSPKLNKSGIRLADGVERCRSPQSIYSARLASKPSSLSQCSSPNRSVYYYSDTLKRDSSIKQQDNCKQGQVNQVPITEGEEVIHSEDSIDIEMDTSFVKPLQGVNTVIVLLDSSASDNKKKGSATLV